MKYDHRIETAETAVIPMADFLAAYVDIPRFAKLCEECPNYNVGWSCPPYDFDPMELWERYSGVKAVGVKIVFDDDVVGTKLDHDAWQELYDTVMSEEKAKLYRRLKEEEKAEEGRFLLHAGGGCPVCDRPCDRRKAPCRHREELRYSMESLGGNVAAVTEDLLHYPLCWIEDGKIPPYLTLVGGMLYR